MPIPINPLFIQGATPYTLPPVSFSSKICEPPANKVPRIISLQFEFTSTYVWHVNLKQANAGGTPALEKIASMAVDTSQILSDVYFYFPDTGFGALIPAGSAQIINIPTADPLPEFYVILGANDPLDPSGNGGRVLLPPPFNICNIILSNQLLPPQNTNTTIRNIMYGMGSYFFPSPVVYPDTLFDNDYTINAAGVDSQTIISASRWFMNNLDINLIGNTIDNNSAIYTATLNDNGVVIASKKFLLTPNIQNIQLWSRDGLHYKSAGSGNLTIDIDAGTPQSMTAEVTSNVYGGILTP